MSLSQDANDTLTNRQKVGRKSIDGIQGCKETSLKNPTRWV